MIGANFGKDGNFKILKNLTENVDRYEYLENEAIADIAFKAYADSLDGIFYQAGLATANLQTDLEKLSTKEIRKVSMSKTSVERLLKNFLDEILYLKDADLFFVKDIDVSIEAKEEKWELQAELSGDIFDHENMPMHNDLKAITWHNFSLQQLDDGSWSCYVLIDI